MLPWVSLLTLASVSGQPAPVPTSVISLHPPWTTAFEGEMVRLTCAGTPFNSARETTWLRQDKTLKTSSENTIEVGASGDYRCQAGGSRPSDPVSVVFSKARLILQAPPAVFEGDTVVLRCRAQEGWAASAKTMYKDHSAVRVLDENSELRIHGASSKDSGVYQCHAHDGPSDHVTSNTVKVHVRELFPHPVLRTSPAWPTQGHPVTLTCETRLPPQRAEVQLQFCFSREDEAPDPRSCSSDPRLRIASARCEDSGSYRCQARTVTHSVAKNSTWARLHVKRPAVHVHIRTSPAPASVFEGQELVLICSISGLRGPVHMSWYRGPTWGPGAAKIPVPPGAQLRISSASSRDAGKYHCVANNSCLSSRSQMVTVTVRVPASRPVLTLRPPETQAVVGTQLSLQCGASRGSLPILYQFFHDDVFLKETKARSWQTTTFSFSASEEHSGSYYCTADNGQGPHRSEALTLSVMVPAARPVLSLRVPGAPVVPGHTVELRCEAPGGSPPILYRFYHEDGVLGNRSAPSGGAASFHLSVTVEHSGNFSCEADNGWRSPRSEPVPLRVTVPAARPVLSLRVPGAPVVPGHTVELRCEAPGGSPPILYRFYHEDGVLGNRSAPSGGAASFHLSVTAGHSGNFSCEADNGRRSPRSEPVPLRVTVPAARPVLSLRVPGAPVVPGHTVELRCEAPGGSPPILYRFYHEDGVLGNRSAPSGGAASFNLSVTAEHSGNFSCEADNGLGAQRSELVPLCVAGVAGHRGGTVAAGVTGVLLSLGVLAALALLLFYWLPGRAGKTASRASSCPADSAPQEPTYHNVPAWVEMQPVYSNVNPKGGDVVYSEVRCVRDQSQRAAEAPPGPPENADSQVIYSQLKVTSTPGAGAPLSASSAPHR